MDIQIKEGEAFSFSGDKWRLSADYDGYGNRLSDAYLLKIQNECAQPIIEVLYDDAGVKAKILFYENGAPGMLAQLDAIIDISGGARINIINTLNRIALYVNGMLFDEDWPLGVAPLNNCICATAAGNWSINPEIPESREFEDGGCGEPIAKAQNWRPEGHNTGVGDCMPFYHNGIYHLFYLFDRRGHKSKRGLGAHQWAHISTTDLINWTRLPMAIAIDSQWEGSICTGSLTHYGGGYYAFFAVRMSDGGAARLTWAYSGDCVTFTKSGRYFELGRPYDAKSARDPCVTIDSSGAAHMFVTTSIQTGKGSMGCLAHLTSPDLRDWTTQEPLVVCETEDQPECPDYFHLGDWYYLIYGIRGVSGYYVSDKPFGPWRRPENNTVIGPYCRVPKTAGFAGDRIIAAGFIVDPPGRGYAGRVYFNELIQKPDGTFDFVIPEEMAETV
jgi:hypothetical protein